LFDLPTNDIVEVQLMGYEVEKFGESGPQAVGAELPRGIQPMNTCEKHRAGLIFWRA